MQESTPVRVVMGLTSHPGTERTVRDIWLALRRLALSGAACTEFEITKAPPGDSDITVNSSWRSEKSFHRFVRESGLLWLDRSGGYPHLCPNAIRIMPAAPAGREMVAGEARQSA